MRDLFKINVYFDEKGEEIEKLISQLLINRLENTKDKFSSLQYLNSLKN